MLVLNCFLSLAYSIDVVVNLLCESIPAAPNLILPTFKEFIAILKPSPLLANIFSFETIVSLKKTCLVEDALIPNLCSSSPSVIPFSGLFSTIKAVMFLSFSILANTIKRLQNPAFEIHIFCPLIL